MRTPSDERLSAALLPRRAASPDARRAGVREGRAGVKLGVPAWCWRSVFPAVLAACTLVLPAGCRHVEPRPAWDAPSGEPAWRVLYGQGNVRKGTPRAPECRVGTDGTERCGHHCRTGRDGRVACAATAEGTCEVRPDGRAVCVDSPPVAPAPR